MPASVVVRYVDRWEPSVNSSLFPELGDAVGFLKPDIVADLDADRLSGLADGSQDFIIASHVIEHLANPLAMLADCYRVLRPGGRLVLLVPDRHQTFDKERSPTALSSFTAELRADEIALHRRRSVHVHLWNCEEFTEVLIYASGALGLERDVVDTMAPGAEGTHGDEFGWILARARTDEAKRREGRRFPRRRTALKPRGPR